MTCWSAVEEYTRGELPWLSTGECSMWGFLSHFDSQAKVFGTIVQHRRFDPFETRDDTVPNSNADVVDHRRLFGQDRAPPINFME